MRRWNLHCLIVALAGLLPLINPPPAVAAENAAIGGIGGIDNGTLLGGDGTGSARISLFSTDLALIKQARNPDGTVLPDGAPVFSGRELYFVLAVENPTDVPAEDVRISDQLDETQFTYIYCTLEQTVLAGTMTDSALWNSLWIAQTDAAGPPDDGTSVMNTTGPPGMDRVSVGADATQPNRLVSIPPRSTVAIRFKVGVN